MDFSRTFEEKLLEITSQDDVRNILRKKKMIIRAGWNEDTFERNILDALSYQPQPKNFVISLCNTIAFAFDYGISQELIYTILNNRENIFRLNEIVIKNIDSNSAVPEIKQLEDLISEIDQSSRTYPIDECYCKFKKIEEKYMEMHTVTKASLASFADKNDISHFHQGKHKPGKAETSKKIAYVWKAMELTSLYKIRKVQVLTVLMMYDQRSERGKLAQVNTGEGKTIIIAMLAALMCLDGRKVDIVTTSPELAVPQSKQLEEFFRVLRLKSSNIDKGDKQDAYKGHVVYGSVNEFEGDVLHDEFMKEGTRVGRLYDIVIVDEADSMLVDGINNTTRLSSPSPGMNTLLPVLIKIWDLFEKADNSVRGKLNQKQNVLEMIEEMMQGNVLQKIEMEIRELLESGNLRIPLHLKKFVLEHQLKIWIQSANTARYHLKLDRQYVMRDNDIKIVDLHNSGIVFKNMKYSDGLHQFLQIKHNVQLTCEDLVTNFLANATFFLKYEKIYGLTGTLGCYKTREFLKETYNTDTIVIPPFKTKQHTKLTPIIVNSRSDWYEAIVDSCKTKLHLGRAVLIIADSIATTDEIKSQFISNGFEESHILMYQTENDSKIGEQLIYPGYAVITTNICGRGVNIFPSPEARGGLHICLTFLPQNRRVEDQNIGRTSRSGNPGTSQIILLANGNERLDDVKRKREEVIEQRLDSLSKDIERTRVKAQVFKKFCAFFNYIDKTSPMPREWNVNPQYPFYLKTEQFCGAIKENFSIWLKKNEHNPNELHAKYNEFERSMIAKFMKNAEPTTNVFFYILSGVNCLQTADYPAALRHLTQAINLDDYYSAFAFLNRSVALLAQDKFDETLHDLNQAKIRILSLAHENKKLADSHSGELRTKYLRQNNFLNRTVESIEKISKWNANEITIPYALYYNKKINLVFEEWLDELPSEAIKECKKDVIELISNGWIGPVQVANRKIGRREQLTNWVSNWAAGCS